MLAEEKLRFYGSWCPHKQTLFCQNREGCSDCCIHEEYEIATITTAQKIIAA
ncbi:hypothetical protein [Methanocella arvoryzae]|uniref:hypothetical protein n=1 Tax=Methanocella arvoryzae TaxID=1175445 RepID=UPI0003253200|nr:hypothetical protein [Methanocella arvoryzae]